MAAATPVLGQSSADLRESVPSQPSLQSAPEAARTIAWAVVLLTSVLSTYVGVIYWFVQSWLAGMILSVLVPGFGLASTLWSLAG